MRVFRPDDDRAPDGPRFRPSWRQVAAALELGLVAIFIVGGLLTRSLPLFGLRVLGLAVVLLAPSVGKLRAGRSVGLSRRRAAGAWLVLALTSLVTFVATGAPSSGEAGPAADVTALGVVETPTPVPGVPLATLIVIVQTTPGAAPPTPTRDPGVIQPGPTAAALRPTSTPALPSPLRADSVLVVNGAGADGVSIRAEPGTGERIRVWDDGTIMVGLGQDQIVAGREWRKVRDPDGNDGWVAADFLVPLSSAPSPVPRTDSTATATPTTGPPPTQVSLATPTLPPTPTRAPTRTATPTRASVIVPPVLPIFGTTPTPTTPASPAPGR